MRILILDTYYPAFLSQYYARTSEMNGVSYDQQLRLLLDQCFGTGDFYSSNLIKLGCEAAEIIMNCEPLQRRWALEHQVEGQAGAASNVAPRGKLIAWFRRPSRADWLYSALASQIKAYRPDVLYVQDMNWLYDRFLREIKQYARLTVGQIACPVAPGLNFQTYDLIISSFPHFVDRFRSEGLDSEYLRLGFEPKILHRLTDGPRYSVVFVGHLSRNHQGRIEFLEHIASSLELDVWGPGVETLEPTSPLRKKHHGEVWALDMYNVLYCADIVINHHIDLAESYANNMRLYETTGVGSLLLTDWKDNLGELFEPGREIVTYNTAGDAVDRINYFLEHPQERKEIASAGKKRTLHEHSYFHRMQELTEILQRRLSRGAAAA